MEAALQSPAPVRAPREEVFLFPASFGQQRLWFLHQYAPTSSAYNIPTAYRLGGPLNVSALRAALDEVRRRHEVLRTVFRLHDGAVEQIVEPASAWPVRIVALDSAPGLDAETELQRLLADEATRPFDLARGPLVRAVLIRLAAEDHVLVVVFHHIVCDGWSTGVFHRELGELYGCVSAGQKLSLPDLPIQYADYAVWQRERTQGDLLESQARYWTTQLAGAPLGLDFPTDQPRPRIESFRGQRLTFHVDLVIANALRTLARREEVTLFVVLQAAFKTLLARYCQQEDIVVGSPVAARTRTESEGLIGFFVNTLALRTSLAGDPPFRELLQRVKATALGAFANQDLPFERLVDRLPLPRDTGRTPLFQVVFAMQNFGDRRLRLGGLRVEPLEIHPAATPFDFTWYVYEHDTDLECRLDFSTDLFDVASMRRLTDHWRVLLEGIVARPEARLSELPLLTEPERHQSLVEWNQTARPYPRDRCVHELFEEHTQARPNSPAVCQRDVTWTYGELNRSAERIAFRLHSLGVAPDQLVGLCVERSPEMVAALLGILKAGGAYWPLDAALPDERVTLLLSAARPAVLIVQSDALARFRSLAFRNSCGPSQSSPTILSIEELLASATTDETRSRPNVQPEHLAYVMYTSGSTGRPKGVMVSHRGVVRLVKNADYVSLSSEETLLHLAPLSFDASTFEIWGALLNGGRLALMPPGQASPAEIGEAIRRHGVTTLWLTAALFHLMVEERLDDLKPLRQLLAGGDVLSPQHVACTLRALPGCRLINGYGPTENTTFTCCHTICPTEDGSRPIPIGRPIANTRVYVLDGQLQPVPLGVPGELFATGDGLARGYLGEPERTAERFLPDPFSSTPSARMYRTGDRVRYRADGTLEFLSRLDRQVKVRGFRVELEEIEAVLLGCPGVNEAAVVTREVAGERQLIGYVAAPPDPAQATEFWRSYLKRHLPDYMVPSALVRLDHLPRSPNGKIDRTALPPPDSSANHEPKLGADPVNMLELELLRIWQRLFGRIDFGRQDNFFDLGGHSLLAARLAVEVERLLGHRLPIASLFQAPTVESIARILQDKEGLPAWTSLVPLQPLGSKPPCFFVHGWGGDVFSFVTLARLFGPDQPVYGLQAVGVDGLRPRHTSVEEMAAHYVKEIRSFQPEGPYSLGGYSLGGWIAWEVAQQLRRAGLSVAMLALVDTHGTCRLPLALQLRLKAPRLLGRSFHHLRRFLQMPPREWLNYFKGRWAALRFHLWRVRPAAPVAGSAPAAIALPGTATVSDYFHELSLRYRPSTYGGTVDLFRCEDTNPQGLFAIQRLASGGVRVHSVAGNHLTMIDQDHVAGFAAAFRHALTEAQERSRNRK